MIATTLNRIRAHEPCRAGWVKLLAGLGKAQADDEPLPFAEILRINGLDDALWACRCEPQHGKEWRLFAAACARDVQHLMTDPRSVAALDVAERYASGEATNEELREARSAAYAAYATVYTAADAADAAAAYAAAAADAAAAYAAYATVYTAAADAADAAAAYAAARKEIREKQTARFLELVS